MAEITSVRVPLPLYKVSSFDSEIHLTKRKLFTEYYHNNQNTEILGTKLTGQRLAITQKPKVPGSSPAATYVQR